jgi:hypothetical protein
LRFGCEAKILPAVIEAVAILVVNHKVVRGIHNVPVHTGNFCSTVNFNGPSGIKFIQAAGEEPFEIVKTVIILLVQDCPVTLTQVNFAE